MTTNWIVRPFAAADIPALLNLMIALARFEGYVDDFAISEADLAAHGLSSDPAFRAWVAQAPGDSALTGMAVTYDQPWTYHGQLNVVLKELYVVAEARGGGAGGALLRAVVKAARARGARQLNWCVMAGNRRAEAFYRAQGGVPDSKWNNWMLRLN